MEKQFKKLKAAHNKYESEVGNMEALIADKIDFEFGIECLAGDGFCILHQDSANLAPLSHCIRVIKQKGILTEDEFEKLTI